MDTQERQTGLARVAEACAYLKISRTKMYEMLRNGDLPYTMVGCHKRIPWTAIYKFAGEDA